MTLLTRYIYNAIRLAHIHGTLISANFFIQQKIRQTKLVLFTCCSNQWNSSPLFLTRLVFLNCDSVCVFFFQSRSFLIFTGSFYLRLAVKFRIPSIDLFHFSPKLNRKSWNCDQKGKGKLVPSLTSRNFSIFKIPKTLEERHWSLP